MSVNDFFLVLVAVAMSAGAQLLLKLGMSSPGVKSAFSGGGATEIAVSIATTGNVVAGLFLYGASAVVWLFVLARLDLSLAYPFVGLGFVATMLLGALVLGEQVTWMRIAGTLLICAGCALVARTG